MGVHVAVSTVSNGSLYNRKNMTDPQVISNRKKYFESEGIALDAVVRLKVHFETEDFCRYLVVDEQDKGRGTQDDDIQAADVLITKAPGVGLFLPVADCIGAAIYDPENTVLAVAHLGRHSLEQNGAFKIIKHLEDTYGSQPAKLQLWLTPAAGPDVYKIWALQNKGMKEATYEQLIAAGVSVSQVQDNAAETTSDPTYFSYSEYLKGNRSEDGDHGILAWIY